MFEIFKDFTFEAAHQLAANVPAGHPYSRIHGHSFRVRVTLRGPAQSGSAWLYDFAEIEAELRKLHSILDHNYLNDVEGLELPTLENISAWIWDRLIKPLPTLDRVQVERGTCGEGCIYSGRQTN
jgi:6-pyruvoyltetrahydropterin/6-carboxytetrahydropterin synthase